MTVYQRVLALQDQMTALRRQIHAHPELAWQEVQTQKLICDTLDEIGIAYETPCKTAVIAKIEGTAPHPCVVLRADMDALSVTEQTNAPYQSQNIGCMHACGHDSHVAMLLTAARILHQERDALNGTIVLLFQPAEEIAGGAKELLPYLDQADDFLAVHVWNDFPLGAISTEAGARMAATDHLEWTVHGLGAHGAQPHHGIDAIVVAAQLITALQTVVSRFTSPLDAVVLTLGQIQGGTGYNIIADEVRIIGTLRTFDATLRDKALTQIQTISTQTACAFGASCDFVCHAGNPPVCNHPDSSARATKAVRSALGEQFVAPMEKIMGGEDFAWYLQQKSGCMCFIGSRNEQTGKCAPHHHPAFDIDEQAMVYGATLYVQYALEWLQA